MLLYPVIPTLLGINSFCETFNIYITFSNCNLLYLTMEEDIEISLSPVRKSQPKQGRRAGPTGHNDGDLEEANVSMSNLRSRPVTGDLFTDDNNKGQASAGPPTHGRRTGGWADETSRLK
jgi:hypothetical protein